MAGLMLTLDDLTFLTSVAGQALLDELADKDLSDTALLPLLTSLRRHHTAQQVSAAVTTARLRMQAVQKFGPAAARLFFDADALEQASHPHVRRYRAQQAGAASSLLDVGCSVGSDSLAFAAVGGTVLGIDLDPVRIRMAQLNADSLGYSNAVFRVADATMVSAAELPRADLVFFDPARRVAGRRVFDVAAYRPPLATIHRYDASRRWVKASPGIDLAQIADEPCRVDFISVDGDLKEALLRYEGQGAGAPAAVLLASDGRGGFKVHRWERQVAVNTSLAPEPLGWLLEPDPAIIRAGLVADLAAALGGQQLDASIAYITSEQPPQTPWARAWAIQDWMPFHLKRLRAYLRERGVGRVTVKKRGSAITPEALTASLKLRGSESCTLALTRLGGQPIVLICADRTAKVRYNE